MEYNAITCILGIAHKVQCLNKKEIFDLSVLNHVNPLPLKRKHLGNSGYIDFEFVRRGCTKKLEPHEEGTILILMEPEGGL